MDKLTATTNVVAYGTSYGSFGYWFYRFVNSMSPDAWAVVGIVGSLAFAGLTCISNIIIKVWAIKRGYRQQKGMV